MQKLNTTCSASRKTAVLLFSVCWSAGLFMGTLFAVYADSSVFLRMRFCYFQNVSIPGLLTAVTFPFLLSACAAAVSHEKLMLPIVFCKAFSLAFFSVWVYLSFDSAGWLIRFLLQFTSILSAPAYCWFCLRHLHDGNRFSFGRDLTGCLVYVIFIILTDYFAIAPIWDGIVMG